MKKRPLIFIIIIMVTGALLSGCESEEAVLQGDLYWHLEIEPLQDSITIVNAEYTFEAVDSNFETWGLNHPSVSTGKTPIDIYKIIKDATSNEVFNYFQVDLDSLCLTQSQIAHFCKRYSDCLRGSGCATIFLFKENNEYFVASVYRTNYDRSMRVRRFGDTHVWKAECEHYVVVPQNEVYVNLP